MNVSFLQSIKIKYIYGAGIIATSFYQAIHSLYQQVPDSFIVSSLQDNPSEIDGIPVKLPDSIHDLAQTEFIALAMPENFQNEVKKELVRRGLQEEQIICVNYELENILLEMYIRSVPDLITAKEWIENNKVSRCCENIDIEILQAKCHVDKILHNPVPLSQYVYPIQVGAALTSQKICNLQDNIGENISSKNRNYCELTATYYAWKHLNSNYKGLCHYRRIFDIDDKLMKELFDCGADVILPYPTIHFPNIHSQHTRSISDSDWQVMLNALQKIAPEYYTDFESVYQGQFFYNFNILIARREVFDDYCKFLFQVLGQAEKLTNPKGWERADRFAGYMGENLTTLYFRKNAAKLKIVHVGKRWLV